MILPANLLYIDDSASAGCDTMDAVYFQGAAPDHGSAVFDGSDSVIVYYLPSTEGWEESFAGRPTLPYRPLGGSDSDNGPADVNDDGPIGAGKAACIIQTLSKLRSARR